MKPRQELPDWSQVQTAYIAGIIDGEGCISMTDRSNRVTWQLQLFVANTSKPLIDWLGTKFGHYPTQAKPPPSDRNWKIWYRVCVWNMGMILEILRRVLPYLIVKRTQAMLAISYLEWRTTKGVRVHLTAEEKEFATSIREAMQALNKKGV